MSTPGVVASGAPARGAAAAVARGARRENHALRRRRAAAIAHAAPRWRSPRAHRRFARARRRWHGAGTQPERHEGAIMRVDQVMTKEPKVCRPSDSLNEAARLMWEHDCGCVPIVDDAGRAVGIVTDRDLCMAAYTRGLPLREVRVGEIMSQPVVSCAPDSAIESAEALMGRHQVRRLVVVGFDDRLVGVVSLGDLARAARQPGHGHARGLSAHALEDTLAAVCQPRSAQAVG
jgi:CBS domain-containing protein